MKSNRLANASFSDIDGIWEAISWMRILKSLNPSALNKFFTSMRSFSSLGLSYIFLIILLSNSKSIFILNCKNESISRNIYSPVSSISSINPRSLAIFSTFSYKLEATFVFNSTLDPDRNNSKSLSLSLRIS
jgi:hypothetical protein